MGEYFEALIEWLKALWTDFTEFVTELPLIVLESVLTVVATAITAIPVPGFVENGIDGLFDNIDPTILYFLAKTGIPEGFALLSAGVAFHLVRKAVTLFQW